ncbi:septum formation initiator family protein [bacterium]|nr:septum formation initiator family protein [bacterium]
MREKRHRDGEKKKKSHVLLWIFATVLFSFMLSFFLGQVGMLRLREMNENADRMLMENHKLVLENRQLMEEIRRLRQDPATIEKIAREELHFVSPNDLVLLVPQNPSRASRPQFP